jgi:hypothetical protein
MRLLSVAKNMSKSMISSSVQRQNEFGATIVTSGSGLIILLMIRALGLSKTLLEAVSGLGHFGLDPVTTGSRVDSTTNELFKKDIGNGLTKQAKIRRLIRWQHYG